MPTTTGFTVSKWRSIEGRNTLRGWFSLELPSGLVINDWAYHKTAESSWVSPPAKEYKGKYTPIIEIPDDVKRAKFQESALAAVEEFLGRQG